MRKEITLGTTLHLTSAQHTELSLIVMQVLGQGASSIAYKAADPESKVIYVLKECFPIKGASRAADLSIVWESEELRQQAVTRAEKAAEMQLSLQGDAATANTNTHLITGLLEGYNTVYSLSSFHFTDTYDHCADKDLHELLITCRAVARAVGAYHKSGYLHLDIKPQNIMIYPETRDMVLLLDFDSVTPVNAISTGAIAYSASYAAPEQLKGNRSKIGFRSDIYAIGALIFSRIFQRVPEAEDRSSFADWDFSSNPFFRKLSPKTQRLTGDLLHRTLAVSPEKRYASCEELISALDGLIEESRPEHCYLLSSLHSMINSFVGREKELQEMDDFFCSQECGILALHGIGGIGKTELALYYANRYRANYDAVCFGKYSAGLAELFRNPDFISVANAPDCRGKNAIRQFGDSRTLLIIDNFDTLDDPDTADLFSLAEHCKLLLTTRCDFRSVYSNIRQLEIHELSDAEQFALFEEKAKTDFSGDEAEAVEEILTEIRGYTLLIPLIAQLLVKSDQSVIDLKNDICSSGIRAVPQEKVRIYKDANISAPVYNILRTVFDMSSFSEEKKNFLCFLSLLGDISVQRKALNSWIGKPQNDLINSLAEESWIKLAGTGKDALISVHPVIREIVLSESTPVISDLPWVNSYLSSYLERCNELSDELHEYSEYYSLCLHYLNGDYVNFDLIYVLQEPMRSEMRAKAHLNSVLISNLLKYNPCEENLTASFSFFEVVIDLDIERAYNFIYPILVQLAAIRLLQAVFAYKADENDPLEQKIEIFEVFSSMVYLMGRPDIEERESKFIVREVETISKNANRLMSNWFNSGNAYDASKFWFQLLSLGIAMGYQLFYTELNEDEQVTRYVSSAAKQYKALVHDLYEQYFKSGKKAQRYEQLLSEFDICMDPEKYNPRASAMMEEEEEAQKEQYQTDLDFYMEEEHARVARLTGLELEAYQLDQKIFGKLLADNCCGFGSLKRSRKDYSLLNDPNHQEKSLATLTGYLAQVDAFLAEHPERKKDLRASLKNIYESLCLLYGCMDDEENTLSYYLKCRNDELYFPWPFDRILDSLIDSGHINIAKYLIQKVIREKDKNSEKRPADPAEVNSIREKKSYYESLQSRLELAEKIDDEEWISQLEDEMEKLHLESTGFTIL